MKYDALPGVPNLQEAQALRRSLTHAITYCEVVAAKTSGGKTTVARDLKAMLDAASTALTAIAAP